jgi:hypothetical protein
MLGRFNRAAEADRNLARMVMLLTGVPARQHALRRMPSLRLT